MAKVKYKAAKLHPAASDALDRLLKRLPTVGFSPETTRQDLLSALVLYTSDPQAAGMLGEYLREYLGKTGSSPAVGDDADDEAGSGS